MKKPILAILALLTFYFVSAQNGGLLVHKGDKGLYLDHEVMPKEGLYAIGRMYNVNPKFLASYNGIDMNKGLNIGQVIHIPLTDTNFSQKAKKGIIPVYYIVGSGDGLQKVSTFNNKVPIAQLKSWNNLKSDNVSAGSKLIIGFLQTTQPPPTAAEKPAVKEEPKKTEVAAVKQEVIEEKKAEPTVVKTEPKEQPVPVETKAVIKEEPKKEEPRKTETAVISQVSLEGEGFFKPYFEQQVKKSAPSKNETVTSGIFKTTSGWSDAKYYLLIDNVPTGNIVKVINPENNKAVYAKVLGEMTGIRQNQGLGIRVSNATAAALGISDSEKFVLKINY